MGRSNFAKRQGLSEEAQNTLGSDLICPAWFPFSVEAKNYADSPIYHTIITGDDPKLNHWLGEACFDAKNFGKIPILFFKTTRKGAFVAFPTTLLDNSVKPTHSLQYNEFTIVGVEHFVKHKEYFRDCALQLPRVLEWLETSPRVAQLIQFVDDTAAKKKKAK